MLDFGRTTFGASCTGAAKFCVERARAHALARVQFQQPLASFELVKEKLAFMAAGAFAMESATYQTAALIDSGADDYMLETAMLKVFATDVLWRIINDTIQLFGGKAYFTDEPYERMMRDARINMIGEGANDVLRVFTGLVGMRDVGLELKGVLDAAHHPLRNLGRLSQFGRPSVRINVLVAGYRRTAWGFASRSGQARKDSWRPRLASRKAVAPSSRGRGRSAVPAGEDRRCGDGALRLGMRAASARMPCSAAIMATEVMATEVTARMVRRPLWHSTSCQRRRTQWPQESITC